MLELGDTAPDFTLELTSGRDFNLYSTLNNCSVLIKILSEVPGVKNAPGT